MLSEFFADNFDEIVARARARVKVRTAPRSTDEELEKGVPYLVRRLARSLGPPTGSADGADGDEGRPSSHGGELLRKGFRIEHVVHDYGDICQVVTALAVEKDVAIGADEFHRFNGCLDDAIAQSVTEYQHARDEVIGAENNERLRIFAHELRNSLATATLALELMQRGTVGFAGSTAGVLTSSLSRLRTLVDRTLAEVRLDAGQARSEPIAVAGLIEDVEIPAAMEARSRELQLSVGPVDPGLIVRGDRQLLGSALTNVVQNALKFTHPGGNVWITTRATPASVFIDVADQCGGLPSGKSEELFRPFAQRGADRSGLGLGLSISRRALIGQGGALSVRDLPGEGCVFTLTLMRPGPTV
ncbi:MAG: hypothetical protein NVSMB47_20920 [Polyangiales bacterium]